MLCSKCKKRVASVFTTRLDKDGKPVNEGLCLMCAREENIPGLDDLLKQNGLEESDIDEMMETMDSITDMSELFDGAGLSELDDDMVGGTSQALPGFMKKLFGTLGNGDSKATAKGEDKPVISDGQKREDTASQSKTGKKAKKDKNDKLKFLSNYCTNLTERAANNELDTIIGRDNEIYRVTQILSRRTKNNPCLIGEPGVGKTAIAEGIAQRIVSGNVPFRLLDKQLYLLDLTSLVAGTHFRGQFESRVKGLIEEVKSQGNIILFIDEVHTLVGTGDSEGSTSAANILKPALSRGEVQVIGATTFAEYRKHIEKDAALERRFQPVTINEPSIADAISVLKGVSHYYEEFHKVKVSEEIINLAVVWSERYITDRYLPDKAIDLLDEACSCCSLKSKILTEYEKLNKGLKELYDSQKQLEEETEIDYEKITLVKSDILKTSSRLKELEPEVIKVEVSVEDLAKVIELYTGIPSAKIEQTELRKIGLLGKQLKERIIGQDEAVEAVVSAIKRNRLSLSKNRRPSSFIFVGPTGVGKTELVKVLSNTLFDSVEPLIRLDMSEYMEKHSVSKLVGSPPGYVGYDDAGQLTEKVRRRPYSVILFDEIEKAHPDVMNILLQILDEGKITDSHGRHVNFENTVIVMTSNAGSSEKGTGVGFNKSTSQMNKEKTQKALSEFLRPEFLGRVDEIVVFNKLENDDIKKIAALLLDELKEPLQEKHITFSYDEKALDVIAKLSHGGKYNARDIRKTIRKEVEDRIANAFIDNIDNTVKELTLTADEEITLVVA